MLNRTRHRSHSEKKIDFLKTGISKSSAGVRDVHRQVHYVMVEPTHPATQVATGETLLLVRREGELFIGLAEGETLTALDDRPVLFG